jgi:hypothetical protein
MTDVMMGRMADGDEKGSPVDRKEGRRSAKARRRGTEKVW